LPIEVSALNLPALPSEEELNSLIGRGMIITQDGAINLTSAGMAFAEQIVRRHRLAERLFSEILELKDSALNSTSCSFEHVLDNSVTESVCTILGHPPTCPHGKRIPPGECCTGSRRQVAPIVIPLNELPVGQEAKIVFITTPHHQRLSRLVNLGVVPGGRFSLHQRKPSYLLKLGSTEIAIDESIAREIYVRMI
jgi:DtxR family Mn-dependent transcriptional regulator